ncbi:MAG TPA: alginate export family protein [Bacteroidales bacterium]|nr:alginate export family protein [Bacteroidales bacterium]
MKRIIIHILFLTLISQILLSQGDLTGIKFDLSVRYRFEVWNGMNAKNYGDDNPEAIGSLNDKILLQRIIPGVTYLSQKITASFHIQDSRAFGWSLQDNKYPDLFKIRKTGTESPYYTMNPQEEYFEIYDLYLEYKNLFKNITVKAGRQKVFYGDYRILGPGDWGNTGRWTWDAIKISYKNGDNFIDIFGGGTKIHDPLKISIPFTNTEFWGGGLYSHSHLTNWLDAEPFYAMKTEGSADYINTQSINRNWYGIRFVNSGKQDIIYDLTYTREFGSENGKRINAYGYFIKAGYRFNSLPTVPVLSLRYTYASGGKKSDDIIHTFDPAFGASDKYYGWMNIVQWSNLSDPEIVLELFPFKKKMWVEIKYNRYNIPVPDDVTILNTMKIKSGKHHLGDETDLFIRYQPYKKWQFTGAIGWFNPGDIEQINFKDPEDAVWFAFQILFSLN